MSKPEAIQKFSELVESLPETKVQEYLQLMQNDAVNSPLVLDKELVDRIFNEDAKLLERLAK
jgi:hypothetical protein